MMSLMRLSVKEFTSDGSGGKNTNTQTLEFEDDLVTMQSVKRVCSVGAGERENQELSGWVHSGKVCDVVNNSIYGDPRRFFRRMGLELRLRECGFH